MPASHAVGSIRCALAMIPLLVFTLPGCYDTSMRPDAAGPDAPALDAGHDDGAVDAPIVVDAPITDAWVTDAGRPSCVPSAEICNMLDDDCDDVADEDPQASTWCGARCGVEACPTARPIAPLSSARATSRRPRFRWTLEGGADEARLEICADRGCGSVLASIVGTTSATPAADLPAGVVFWRLVPRRAGVDLPAIRPPWIARIPPTSRGVDATLDVITDVDADGRADLLLARRATATTAPTEWQILGGSVVGLVDRARLPSSVLDVVALLDVDGDGHADALADESIGGHGALALRRGAPWMLLGTPEAVPSSIVSSRLTTAGDVDADGYADAFFLGAQLARGGTAIAPTSIVVPVPAFAEPSFGSDVYAVLDLDADGSSDFVVEQPCRVDPLGTSVTCPADRSLWLVPGGAAFGAPVPWARVPLDGPLPGPEIATAGAIATAGDIDGDGRMDLVAYRNARAPLLLLNREANPSSDAWRPIDSDDTVAWVGPACDLDGDGADEIVLTRTAWHDTATFVRRGSASGPTSSTIPLTRLQAAGIRCLGDDDGDGLSDVAILLFDPEVDGSFVLNVYRGAPGGLSATPIQSIDLGLVEAAGWPSRALF